MTRSLLGWGVVAGPFYVVVALVLALTRPGFQLSEHALSLLMLGEWGWMQRLNLILTAFMVLAAAWGFFRAIRNGRGLAIAVLVGVYGICLILSAIFPPDPVAGFPPGSGGGTASLSGILHLVFGALGFAALAAAAFAYAGWCRSIGARPRAGWAITLGVLVLLGFFGGAAFATIPLGVLLLWIAVLAGWLWLALASIHVYAWSPHPVRVQQAAATG
ncbi:DUF998 domain-containing protein [Microbacterium timonense]|uniref:DUF998 domain-containing protein n=1 Tax=Microbacterium timonense TaxID=2086576 RepID=UPI001F3D12C3|nr:DUF998 domain-containing protein [Microbacterium timonense]